MAAHRRVSPRSRRIGRPRTGAADAAVGRLRAGAIVVVAVVALTAPEHFAGRFGLPPVAVAGGIAAALAVASAAALWRRQSPHHAFACVCAEVGIDVAVAAFVLLHTGPVGAPALLLALPLVEAGLRFGAPGALAAWATEVAAVATVIAVWVPTSSVRAATLEAAPVLVSLLTLGLPSAVVLERLLRLLDDVAEARQRTDERAALLEAVTAALPQFATADRRQIVDAVLDLARLAGCRRPAVWRADPVELVRVAGDRAAIAHEDVVVELAEPWDRWVLTHAPVGTDDPGAPWRDEVVALVALHARVAFAAAERYEQRRTQQAHDAAVGAGSRPATGAEVTWFRAVAGERASEAVPAVVRERAGVGA